MISSRDLLHHDGSARYVSPQSPKLGEHVALTLYVPKDFRVDRVFLRFPRDGEPEVRSATKKGDHWIATLPMTASRMNYRWLLTGGDAGYLWVTAAGVVSHDITDATDFQITTYGHIPLWAKRTVAYQIFPDRFAQSHYEYDVPQWAVKREWSDSPEGRSKNTAYEYFGGDLWGIIERLDYIQSLGINLIYTTPFFPAGSTHRYDATSFAHVDPLLGGDQALMALVGAAHKRGIKVIGDITLNHTGDHHEWFRAGKSGDPEKRGYYYFDENEPYGYVTWLGVKSLPKLNFGSEALRTELITGPESVLRKFLKAPYNLDGWRVDVANMTARYGDYDQNHEIARLTRWAVEQEGSEKILIGEHNHDAGPDLPGDGWFGNMNYTAFQRPVWSWLSKNPSELDWMRDVKTPSMDGFAMVNTMRNVHSSMPWQSLLSSWNLLGSHDSARIRTAVGSREKHHAAVYLMCTLPGTPMIFAEDEIGAEGKWGEDSRTPFPWNQPETWDQQTLDLYRTLISIRRKSDALALGGLRWVDVTADCVAFLREIDGEAILSVVARDAASSSLDLSSLGYSNADHLTGQSGLLEGSCLKLTFSNAGGAIWSLR